MVTGLSICGKKKKIGISLILFIQTYHTVPKKTLNSIHCFIMKIIKKANFNKLLLIVHLILGFMTL